MLAGSPFGVRSTAFLYQIPVSELAQKEGFNVQIRVLDTLFGLCSLGAYTCNGASQIANSLTAMGASFLAN